MGSGDAVGVNSGLKDDKNKRQMGTVEGFGMSGSCLPIAKRCYIMEKWRQKGKQTRGGRVVCLMLLHD